LEKQNALAAKNTELIKEIEKRQKEINRLQAEIDNLKNENHPETKDAELDSEMEQLLNMN
jgi:molecular chaperone GrpE (heat shock protein)